MCMADKKILKAVINAIPRLMWFLWKNRNNGLFEGRKVILTELVEKTFVEAELWSGSYA